MATNDKKKPCLLYVGTAYIVYDFMILADYCRTRPTQPRREIQDLYDRQTRVQMNQGELPMIGCQI